GELVELAEATFELLEREQKLGELLVARFRRVAERERAGDRLPEEPELRRELGAPFLRSELLLPRLPHRAGAVLLRERRRDALGDRGSRSRVVDLERADHLREEREALLNEIELRGERRELGALVDFFDRDDDRVEPIDERLPGIVLQEERHARLRH